MNPDYEYLRMVAGTYADVQKVRVAVSNRSSGAYDKGLSEVEKVIAKDLREHFRKTAPKPLIAWQKETLGIGEHLLARLIGTVGHPRIATPYHWEGEGEDRKLVADEPFERTLAQFWSYCGHGDPARKKKKGMSAVEAAALGNPRAKMVTHLMAEGCMKQMRSPYRLVYEKARLEYAERTKEEGWPDARKHASALRITGKELLRDIWTVCG